MTTEELDKRLAETDWPRYETAYGGAGTVPDALRALFSGDKEKALSATHDLWCGLCHQHAYVSSAALPAYDFLMVGLKELDDALKVELLDILLGFAACTVRSAEHPWERQLRDKLTADLPVFAGFLSSANEDISCFSERIVEELTGKEGST